ncbi:MAG: HYR domain-containing protein [Acidobacteria bacterium]|nr:HYR domain-containing protein [Acidobacteriota bacterium]
MLRTGKLSSVSIHAAICLLLLFVAPRAMAGDATVAGTATATAPSSRWITVDVPFTGDDDGDGHTLYELSTSAAGPFGTGLADWPKLSGPAEWRANNFNTTASTAYFIRVTFFDPDGVTGANPQLIGPITTPAFSPNSVSVGTATAVARDTEIFVSLPLGDDANRNSGGTVEIATSAGGPYTRKAGSPSEANLPFHPKRARIRGLTPGTNYWIRVTITDPDGVSGVNPQIIGPINYTGIADLALGKPITASPGWGCCPSPSHLVDGRIQNDAWFFGFAWTGGTSCWAGGCPPGLNKHATIDLGAPTDINRAVIWYHDPSSVPVVWKIQTSNDGVNFTDAYSNTDPRCRTATDPLPGAWYYPACGHDASFPTVKARYIRYLFDDSTLFSGLHGWAVEFEVFNEPSCPEANLADTGARIPVGGGPSRAVLTPNGAEVYVSNNSSNTVSVINTASDLVTHTVPVGSSPDSMAVSPDGLRVYVGQHGGGVSVINTATKAVTPINTLGGPVRDLAITPDGTKVYLAMEFAGLKKIDTATNAVSVVSGFACPEGVGVTPDGSTVYVNYQCGGPGGSGGHDAVGRFNAVTGAFLGSITGLPNVGNRLTISPNGAQVWENGGDACISPFYNHVGCPFVPSGVLNVIKTSNNTLQQSLGFSGFSPGITSFLPDSSHALVGNGANLSLFDTSTFALVQNIPMPASGSVAFAPGGKAYAPLPSQNTVAVLSLSCPDTNQAPVADAGADQTIECAGATTSVTLGGSASSDPDGDTPLIFEWSEGATPLGTGATLNVSLLTGTHTITLEVTDPDGESSTDTVVVNVSDTTSPTLNIPPDVNASTGAGATACGVLINDATLGAAAAADGCSGATITRTGVPPGNVFPVGQTLITYTATDGAGNTASAQQAVNVIDDTPPTINAPAAVTVNADPGSCFATNVSPGTPSTGDNCGVQSVTNDAPSSFPVGTTTVTWTGTDASGNIATATQTVTVVDNQNPTINTPANVSASTDAGSCAATLDSGTATAADNCSVASIVGVRSDGQPLGAPYPGGVTTITWTASDASGNSSSAVQTVTVNDTQGPSISSVSANPSSLWPPNHTMHDVTLTYSAADKIVDASHVRLRAERAGGGTGRIYTITVSCTDSHGNSSNSTVTVTVPKSQKK